MFDLQIQFLGGGVSKNYHLHELRWNCLRSINPFFTVYLRREWNWNFETWNMIELRFWGQCHHQGHDWVVGDRSDVVGFCIQKWSGSWKVIPQKRNKDFDSVSFLSVHISCYTIRMEESISTLRSCFSTNSRYVYLEYFSWFDSVCAILCRRSSPTTVNAPNWNALQI